MPARPENALAFVDPGVLQILGQMREDGKGVDEIKRRSGIRKWRIQLVQSDVREREIRHTPLDHPRVDVAAVPVGSLET